MQLFELLKKQLIPLSSYKQGYFPGEAAVLALFLRGENPELLYTLRAQHLFSHAGEVSFPGGKWEADDETLIDTALRETWEEIAIPPEAITLLGGCPSRYTGRGVKVTPLVGVIDYDQSTNANLDEIDRIFTVPASAFAQGLVIRTDTFSHSGKLVYVPAYQYQSYEIWGLTAAITQDILGRLVVAKDPFK